jgi:hypothetical protein
MGFLIAIKTDPPRVLFGKTELTAVSLKIQVHSKQKPSVCVVTSNLI